jgi:hypothetical protein
MSVKMLFFIKEDGISKELQIFKETTTFFGENGRNIKNICR